MCPWSAIFFRKTAILKMVGETESQEVQNQKLEDLSKLCNYAEKLTQGKSFSKWKSEVGRNIQQHDSHFLPELFIKYL